MWCQLGLLAANLLVWLGVLGLDAADPLRRAQPATIRYRLLHVAAKITHHGRRTRLQLDRDWRGPPRSSACSEDSGRYPRPRNRHPTRGARRPPAVHSNTPKTAGISPNELSPTRPPPPRLHHRPRSPHRRPSRSSMKNQG